MESRAIVLSGGGARGAYEAGVVLALLERSGGAPVADLLCGTSIGAVTAAALASGIADPGAVARALEGFWSRLVLEDVLAFSLGQLAALPRLALGGAAPRGLFDARPLMAALAHEIRWDGISEHLAAGRLRALTVTATHVPTGRPHVFVQRRPEIPPPIGIGRRVVVTDARIGPEHVLASAAIPLLFPPVTVGGELFCDGGLRLNTPLGPAIRLGATRVLAPLQSTASEVAELPGARYPGAAFLLGKVLNAFLLDHVSNDLAELQRVNRFLADGAAICGPDFADRLAARAGARGDPTSHAVEAVVIRPSQDLGALAAAHLRALQRRPRRPTAARLLLRLADSPESRTADLASYLLFDQAYTRELLELGRADGRAHGDALDGFLAGAHDRDRTSEEDPRA